MLSTPAGLAVGLLVGSLALAGCAASGPPSRFPRYTEPIKQITLRGGHPGWGGLEIGMSFHDAQITLGKRLTPLGLQPRDGLCGYASVDVAPRRQPLRLEFDPASSGDARLKAIWLLLPDRAGVASAAGIAHALKARFPDLVYVAGRQPAEPEESNPHPIYRAPNGTLFLVDTQLGVYFGELCVG